MATAPSWLRLLLMAMVVGPAALGIAWGVCSVYGTEDWSGGTDAPGFALCGLFVLMAIAVGVIWLAVRTLVARDGEGYAIIAGGCGVGAGLLTISLCEAAAVGLGLKEGRVPSDVVAAVGVAWLYFITVGVGHWYLWRLTKRSEPGAVSSER